MTEHYKRLAEKHGCEIVAAHDKYGQFTHWEWRKKNIAAKLGGDDLDGKHLRVP